MIFCHIANIFSDSKRLHSFPGPCNDTRRPLASDGCRCAGLGALLQLGHPYSVKAHRLKAGECGLECLVPNKLYPLWCNSLHLARAAPPPGDHGPVRRNRTSRRPGRAPGPVWSGRSAGSESFPSGAVGVPGHARWDRAARRRNC